METAESKMYDEATRLKIINTNVQFVILPNLLFVATGREITEDKAALESKISAEIAKYFPAMRRRKRKQFKNNLIKQFSKAGGDLPFDARELASKAVQGKQSLVMMPPKNYTRGCARSEKIEVYKKWLCVRHAIVQAGAHPEIIEPSPDAKGNKDVFSRDRYVMIGDTAYLPDVRMLPEAMPQNVFNEMPGYIAEVSYVEQALKERGIKTVIAEGAWFEGGNIVAHRGTHTLFVGTHGALFTQKSARKFMAAVNAAGKEKWSLLPVPLTNYKNPNFYEDSMYHLDLGLKQLPQGEILLSPLVTDKETCAIIRRLAGEKNVILLSDEDAGNKAANLIGIGNTLIMTNECPEARKKLEARGYAVVSPVDYGLDSFSFGNAGVNCYVNDAPPPARRQPRIVPFIKSPLRLR